MDEEYISRAINLSQTYSYNGLNGPFGAVVVQAARIIGEGWNRVVELNDPTAHAEIMAIRQACSTLKTHVLSDCTIYTSCEPCPMCLAAIYWARLKKVVYACNQNDASFAGFDDSMIYTELQKKWENRTLSSMTLCREKALKVFKAWKENPNKIEY
ncbi:MAG: nucleoside deaminase [Chitinispirillia bacterium]|jgi:tRNA(Arg) A34 adenosine deaminase TadA